jgi:hypothetical protein
VVAAARRPGLVFAVAFTACNFSADFDGTRYRCGVGGTCPYGFRCVAEVCEPEGGGDDGGGDAPGSSNTWRSDSAGDFGAAGHVAVAATVDRRGAVEPIAYYTGGVVVRAGAGTIASSAASWDQASAFAATPEIAIARSTDVSFGNAPPPGVGVSGGDWTLRFEGEIWLEAGAWTFLLLADDHGFLEVAADGATFARVASADEGEVQGVVQVTAADWYPIRWVISADPGAAAMRLRLRGPGVPDAIAIPRHRLRARVDLLDGLALTGFAGERMAGAPVTTIDAVAPAAVDWAMGAPDDLGLGRVDNWSTRWSGQWHVGVAGTYVLRYVSDDGQRLWIDGTKVLDAWDSSSHDRVSSALALAAGWHDVVIDHSERTGNALARVTVDSGPALAGQPLAAAPLRPVEGRGARFESGGNGTDVALPDAPSANVDGIASSTVVMSAPPGAVVDGLEIGFIYDHEYQGDLRIQLIAPGGRVALLRDQTGGASGTITEVYSRTDLDGAPVNGTWTLRFTDIDPGADGTLRDVRLTVRTAGAGTPPMPQVALFESAPHGFGATATLGAVRWETIQPAGTTVRIEVRTCADAATCADSPWVLVTQGATPAAPPGAFAQFRVLMTTDGDRAPSLEWIEIDHE